MKIANKISLSFLFTSIILTTVSLFIVYTVVRNNLKNAIYTHLYTAAESRANHIETFLEEHKQTIHLMSSRTVFKELLSLSEDNLEYDKKLEKVSRAINNVIESHKKIFKVTLLNKNGAVVMSSDKASVGFDSSANDTYLNAKDGLYLSDIHISNTTGKPAIDIAIPVFVKNEYLGVIVADLKAEELFKITLDRTGLGETGEIYLVNKDYYMISPSRFKEDVILKQKVDTINSRDCFQHKSSDHAAEHKEVHVFPDYRGTKVLGTHVYISEMQWGLLAQIDEKEAFAPMRVIIYIFLSILIIVPIVAWLVGVLLSKMISGPIRRLQKGTEIIAKGNLEYRVGNESKDEIGQLSRAFDKMTDDLKKSTISINELNKEIGVRKKAEESLQESEENLVITLKSIGDAVIATDTEGRVIRMNPVAEKLTGWNLSEAKGRALDDIFNIINEETRQRVESPVEKVLREGVVVRLANHTILISKHGIEYPVDDSGAPIRDEEGKIRGVVLVFRDVSEKRQAEKALRFTQFAIDHSSDAAFWMGHDARLIYVNEASCNALGYSREELLTMTVHDIDPDFPEEVWSDHWADLRSNGSFLIESHHRTKDGKVFPVELKVNHVEFGGNEYNCAFARNIFERNQIEKALRESEEKLARSKKMESLGLLAGGVAHDLNNVLSGIVSYPELILMDLPEDSKFRKPIETIQESGHRAAAIVQDLLTVARGVATTREPLNLNDLVADYLRSPEFNKLKHIYTTVTVKTNLDSDLFNINGSQVHVRKVVMNLVSNASEAIEGSGNVTISTMNRYIDRPLRGYDDVNLGEYVVLSVSDDGSGISSDDLERIFEPFYTKKVMGRSGTGLGLSVVWNTVHDHKGYIDVTTDENGTTFELYFPITRDEVSDKTLSVPIKDYKGDGETILVVDDEESQREISCKMLDTLGYKTKAVSSGEKTVEYLKENTVDLILLDMIMDPGINGRETYERIIEIHPKQKAIIISGFAETDEVKEAQKLGAGRYIKKPVTLEKIGLAVKEELEK